MTGHNRKEELLSTMPLKHGQAGSVQNQTVAGKRLCDRPSTLLADIKEKKKHCFRRAMNHLSCNTSIKYKIFFFKQGELKFTWRDCPPSSNPKPPPPARPSR